ncbi:nuclear transport factor 2 family protein [Novosphingobium humi]|uniref:Nuclear transport factor 2 family protein n=1 Tax=Novosphingobium humi TaxID=2282397 RepID=A0ABY7U1Y6_9SPHN|nr:nuclear transport factor 2 family protein [Novosphingobium humi]WCT79140.1 nuclear transport factor 2 family protein [Novosphingobium humi]
MNREIVVRRYLEAMEKGDLSATYSCFDQGGVVKSPVYGNMPYEEFYKKLYGDTVSSKVDIRHIYESTSDPCFFAAHFDYKWVKGDGVSLSSSLVDLFRFSEGTDKIKHLEIIFDRGVMK